MKQLLIFLSSIFVLHANISLDAYNETFASQVAYKYVKVSYCNSNDIFDIKNWSWNNEVAQKYFPKNTNIKTYENKVRSVFSFTTWDPQNQMVVLAYRGTTNIWNWIRNVKYDKLNQTNIAFYNAFSAYSKLLDADGKKEVHLGFYQAYYDQDPNDMLQELRDLLLLYPAAEGQKRQLLVTGHSLGAAQAAIAAYEIQTLLIEEEGLNYEIVFYNFESPRSGNKAFVEDWNKKIPKAYRLVKHGDAVTDCPLLKMGFSHVGTRVYYNGCYSSYTTCAPHEENCDEDDGDDGWLSALDYDANILHSHCILFNQTSGDCKNSEFTEAEIIDICTGVATDNLEYLVVFVVVLGLLITLCCVCGKKKSKTE